MSGHFMTMNDEELFLVYADCELDAVKKLLIGLFPDEEEFLTTCNTLEDIYMADFPVNVYDGVTKIE